MTLDAPRRLHRRRASAPHLIVLLAAAAGLVLTLTALRPHGEAREIAVAARDLQSGSVLKAGDVRLVSIDADDRLFARFVSARQSSALAGRVVTTSMRSGDPYLGANVRDRAAVDGRRAMSIPVARSRAVNGALAPGDRVDVVVAGDDAVEIVAADLLVIAVDDPDGGAFGSRRGEITVTVAVDARQSELLTKALAGREFVLTRVTGAVSASGTEPIPTEGRGA